MALRVVRASPPTVVLSEKLTFLLIGFPFVSRTLNATTDVSLLPAPPVPFSAILAGEADMNDIEPADAALTVIVPVLVNVVPPMDKVAVIVSTEA